MDSPPPPAAPAAPATGDHVPWPRGLREVWQGSVTAEYASLTRTGSPVTVPTTPYVGAEGRTLDVSTGLTYPAKAERARRDPRVCLLFADPVGSTLDNPVTVLVQGLATVRDSDLQANTDRYVRLSAQKYPSAMKGQPEFALRRMAWYFARIWIEITPLHIRWWPSRLLEEPPQSWHAPDGTAAPLSDPAPSGAQPGAWLTPPASWRHEASALCDRLPLQDVTVIDANGFPLCLPVTTSQWVDDGFVVRIGRGAPSVAEGPACFTMHMHPDVFSGQENRTFVGHVIPENVTDDGTVLRMHVDRALAGWSIAGNRARSSIGFLRKGRLLAPRVRSEAARRFQPVPTVKFPSSAD
jgi:hypothetical protein